MIKKLGLRSAAGADAQSNKTGRMRVAVFMGSFDF
jgi:hypothetical protein